MGLEPLKPCLGHVPPAKHLRRRRPPPPPPLKSRPRAAASTAATTTRVVLVWISRPKWGRGCIFDEYTRCSTTTTGVLCTTWFETKIQCVQKMYKWNILQWRYAILVIFFICSSRIRKLTCSFESSYNFTGQLVHSSTIQRNGNEKGNFRGWSSVAFHPSRARYFHYYNYSLLFAI